jgi:hypothetical protein
VVYGSGSTDFRLLQYSYDDGGFVAPNANAKAEHLGKRLFKRSFYTRDPHQIMWSIMEDGTITMLSIDSESDFAAWTRMEMDSPVTDGCSVINPVGENMVFLIVRRVIDGQQKTYIERITDLRFTSRWETMDCLVRTFVDGLSGQIAGFDALEGCTVAVFGDDQYVGEQVVTGGEITLDFEVSKVECGLPNVFSVTTFPQGGRISQTGLTSKKRYSKVGLRGLFGLPPLINGQRPPDRAPQANMDFNEPKDDVYDADIVGVDTDDFGSVTISEVLPFQVTIAAIYGKLTSNQL